ncbi:MAG: hypothetical protein ACI4I7_06465 [Oscillospiraceae bacterium]
MKNTLKITLLFLALTMPLAGCSGKEDTPKSSSVNESVESVESVESKPSPLLKNVPIDLPKDVIEIIVSPYESDLMTFKYTDPQKIENVMDYLRGIRISTTDDDPSNYVGCVPIKYVLTTANGTEKEYCEAGSQFFQEGDSDWFEISDYKIEFEELLKENEPDVPAEKPLFHETE